MTVIAYRDGILACDSAWSDGDSVVTRQNKVFRLDSGALYGAAGDSDDRALVRLLNKIAHSDGLPSRAALADIPNDIEALVIFPSGQLFSVTTGKDDAGAYRMRAPFAAIGAGGAIALGAMAAGASARTACAIAARYDLHCRTPIYTLALRASRQRKK